MATHRLHSLDLYIQGSAFLTESAGFFPLGSSPCFGRRRSVPLAPSRLRAGAKLPVAGELGRDRAGKSVGKAGRAATGAHDTVIHPWDRQRIVALRQLIVALDLRKTQIECNFAWTVQVEIEGFVMMRQKKKKE